MHRRTFLLGAAAAAARVLASRPARADVRPDIIVLLTDDQRTDDWRVMPQTQSLIGGTWLPNFILSTPLCSPARANFFSGRFAHNTGIRGDVPGWRAFRGEERQTIAVALHDAGYRTALTGKYLNHYRVGHTPPGWDDFRAIAGHDTYRTKRGYDTDVRRDDAIDIITNTPTDQPLFLVVAFHAPHNPATPPKAYEHAAVGAAMDRLDSERKRCLLAVDDAVAAIAHAAGSRWDNAARFALTDNGYLLGEHGLRGKATWYDPATRVAAQVSCPGLPAGTDRRLMQMIDIPATILRAAGINPSRTLDGRPLQETWQRDGVLIEGWSTAGPHRSPFVGVKGDGWLYVEPRGKSPRYYADPAEAEDVYDQLSPEDQARYAAWVAALRNCSGDVCRAQENGPQPSSNSVSARQRAPLATRSRPDPQGPSHYHGQRPMSRSARH